MNERASCFLSAIVEVALLSAISGRELTVTREVVGPVSGEAALTFGPEGSGDAAHDGAADEWIVARYLRGPDLDETRQVAGAIIALTCRGMVWSVLLGGARRLGSSEGIADSREFRTAMGAGALGWVTRWHRRSACSLLRVRSATVDMRCGPRGFRGARSERSRPIQPACGCAKCVRGMRPVDMAACATAASDGS